MRPAKLCLQPVVMVSLYSYQLRFGSLALLLLLLLQAAPSRAALRPTQPTATAAGRWGRQLLQQGHQPLDTPASTSQQSRGGEAVGSHGRAAPSEQAPLGASSEDCADSPGGVNCTAPLPGQLPPSNSTNATGGDAADSKVSPDADAAAATALPTAGPEGQGGPQAEALPSQERQPAPRPNGFGRTSHPPPMQKKPSQPEAGPGPGPAAAVVVPGAAPLEPGPEQGQEAASQGKNGGGGLPAWAVAAVASLAGSLAVLAGVAGIYGIRKHRNRHRQYKRYLSSHVSISGAGRGSLGDGAGGSMSKCGALGGGGGGGGGSLVDSSRPSAVVELGPMLGGKTSLGSYPSGDSASDVALVGPSSSHPEPSPVSILAAYPAEPEPSPAWQPLPHPHHHHFIYNPLLLLHQQQQQQQQHGVYFVGDEATPMDADESSPDSSVHLFLPSVLPAGPPLPRGDFGSPDTPATPALGCTEEGEEEEGVPMELESLGGTLLAPNPWAGVVAMPEAQHQLPPQPQRQQMPLGGAIGPWGVPPPSPFSTQQQQPPPPLQQQQREGWPAMAVGAASPAAQPPAVAELWRPWDAGSAAGRLAGQAGGAATAVPSLPLPLSRLGAAAVPSNNPAQPAGQPLSGSASHPGRSSDGGGEASSCSAPQRQPSEGSGSGSRTAGASSQLPSLLGENDWEIDPDEIEICKRPDGSEWQLGAGAFGKVYKALRGGVSEVAVKVLAGEGPGEEDEGFRREVAILRGCRDAHVVQFLGACFHPGRTMLVCELMEGGDLRTALSRAPAAFRWGAGGRGRALALDVARGLHFLHSRRVIHFDLTSKNILLSADGGVAKIADVGLAAVVSHKYISLAGLRGAFAWAAPEVLTGERHCSEKVDCFSLGVVLWELVTGEVPQRGRMREPRVPEECPPEVAALIDRCLSVSPNSRPSAKETFQAIAASPKTWTCSPQQQRAQRAQHHQQQ